MGAQESSEEQLWVPLFCGMLVWAQGAMSNLLAQGMGAEAYIKGRIENH